MKVIIVTGSVGAGKTFLSKKLVKEFKEMNYKYIDVNKLINENKLYAGYDKKRKCKIVDIKELNRFLTGIINKYKKIKKIGGIIIDSHLSHYLPKKYVDKCFVVKCDLKELSKRLKKRGYNPDKIRENLECEIFDVCLNEAKEAKHDIIIVKNNKQQKRPKIGLFIGRFQPFHNAHLQDVKEALNEVDKLIIAIGSSQESYTKENPFNYKERKEMIEKTLEAHHLSDYEIWPVPDINNNKKWVSYVKKIVPKFTFVYTGNKITEKLFKEKNIEIKKIKLIRGINATEIRKRIVEKGNWKALVPKEVEEYIRKIIRIKKTGLLT